MPMRDRVLSERGYQLSIVSIENHRGVSRNNVESPTEASWGLRWNVEVRQRTKRSKVNKDCMKTLDSEDGSWFWFITTCRCWYIL